MNLYYNLFFNHESIDIDDDYNNEIITEIEEDNLLNYQKDIYEYEKYQNIESSTINRNE